MLPPQYVNNARFFFFLDIVTVFWSYPLSSSEMVSSIQRPAFLKRKKLLSAQMWNKTIWTIWNHMRFQNVWNVILLTNTQMSVSLHLHLPCTFIINSGPWGSGWQPEAPSFTSGIDLCPFNHWEEQWPVVSDWSPWTGSWTTHSSSSSSWMCRETCEGQAGRHHSQVTASQEYSTQTSATFLFYFLAFINIQKNVYSECETLGWLKRLLHHTVMKPFSFGASVELVFGGPVTPAFKKGKLQ